MDRVFIWLIPTGVLCYQREIEKRRKREREGEGEEKVAKSKLKSADLLSTYSARHHPYDIKRPAEKRRERERERERERRRSSRRRRRRKRWRKDIFNVNSLTTWRKISGAKSTKLAYRERINFKKKEKKRGKKKKENVSSSNEHIDFYVSINWRSNQISKRWYPLSLSLSLSLSLFPLPCFIFLKNGEENDKFIFNDF